MYTVSPLICRNKPLRKLGGVKHKRKIKMYGKGSVVLKIKIKFI